MKFKDYYETFGLPREATQDEIKRAYRKLARKYHPDVSKAADAEARFKELGEAYAVLKDPEKRAAYDQMGSQWRAGQDFQPPPDWNAGFEFSGATPAPATGMHHSDFFEALFGRQARGARRSGQPWPRRGPSRQGADRSGRRLPRRPAQHLAARAGRWMHRVMSSCASAGSTSASPRASVPASICASPDRASRAWAMARRATCTWRSLSTRTRVTASMDAMSSSICRWPPGRPRSAVR